MLNGIFDTSKSCFEDRFITDMVQLKALIDTFRSLHPKAKVGFVGGVWDLIHLGHMAYIEKAKEDMDLLIVGADTDEFTRSRKSRDGVERPIVPFEERVMILSYLRSVDIIIPVDENFIAPLEAIRPDKLVFSRSTNDMKEENLKKYEAYAGEMVFLEPQAPPEKTSTTARVRHLMMSGVKVSRGKVIKRVNATVDKILNEVFDEIEAQI
ncbi:adenylyltransferase/cytidyltransferase family protein [bacterium]|nr:MAG: adenylyltransferase/cytidyltransferase family protein [bacterium]